MGKLKHKGSIKELKYYTLIEGELYRRLPRGILSRCISKKEGKLKLKELHNQICGVVEKTSPYRRIQRMGVLLAQHEQSSCNCTRKVPKLSTLSGQKGKLCCIHYERLEDPIYGIIDVRDLAS